MGSQRRTREFAEHAAVIASHDPSVLLVGAGNDPSQPAPLSLHTLGLMIGHAPAPIRGRDQAANPDDQVPEFDSQGSKNQQPEKRDHAASVAPATDTAPRITRRT